MYDEVYYKREGEKEWRGPDKVIDYGSDIREIARVYITRIIVCKDVLLEENMIEEKNQKSSETQKRKN